MKNDRRTPANFTFLVLLAVAAAGPAAADDHDRPGTPFLVLSTVSYHTRDHAALNGENPGVGVGVALTDRVDLLGGTFRNSYAEQSNYAMARVRLGSRHGALAAHLSGGYLDGYDASFDGKGNSVAVAVDVQYGPLVFIAAPAPQRRGLVLSLWLAFDGPRGLFGR